MTREDALRVIDDALAEIQSLRSSRLQSPSHVAFIQTTGMELKRIFGSDSTITKNFARIVYHHRGNLITDAWHYEDDLLSANENAYQKGLDVAEGILRSARHQVEQHGIERLLRESRIRSEGARVFVSHGKESPSLVKVERFLRALGLNPVVVVREPSEGMSVDALVDKRMSESDCAIILATGDDEVAGHRQPRLNLIHEIGLAQEKFAGRVIYLKEIGCEFPSNVRPMIWENFTQDNMEQAFERITKELRSFGFL